MRNLLLVLGGLAVAVAVVVGVVAALVVGGDDDEGQGPPAQETPTAEATGTPATGTGGELRLLGRDPLTLDPACASDVDSANYIVEIFGGLVTIDRDLQIVPDIAEEIPEPIQNADGTASYTFQLRQGVLFHKGDRQVTASDVKYSIERALDPETQSTVAETYLGDIVGVKEFVDGEAEEVSGIEVVDNYTLRITIDAPKPAFLAKLTYPTAFVVDRNQVEGSTCFSKTDWQRRPNATGPFKLKEWSLLRRIVLEPNTRYHLGPPSVDRVVYTLGGGSAITMYENDEIDVTGVGLNDIERVRAPAEPLHQEFQEAPRMDIWYIGFNVTKPPFDDVKVRQAFAHAIDKEKLIEVVLLDAVVKADGILPPGIPGFNENLEGLGFDPERARRLLAESKYGGPGELPKIEIASSGRGASVGPVSEALLAMWEKNLGVKISTRQTEFATFLRDLHDGKFQMFELGWVADYPDPENFLGIQFHSLSLNNYTQYANAEVDRLLEEAETESDEATRLSLYQQAEQIIVNEAPWIPLFHDKFSVLIKPYVKDYVLPPFVIPRMRYVHIEK
ncbi:MAG: peptide ABC transporter substrate-binding protein [Dehalococcoidia bacterium]